jgi:flagellar basal-body rod protein FlgB
MQRQTLLTNNLTNANTPGYQRQDLDFQGALANAMQSGQSPDTVAFSPFTQHQVVQADGNGVDPNQESADIAENGLLYQTFTQIAATRELILEQATGTK